MLLSIVITTYNRAVTLRNLLRHLENQTDKHFQVVVAIDGSTDRTESMLQSLDTAFDLKWINTHCKGYGLAVARNRGILASDGEAVVILDDDSFPEPQFVLAHKASVKKNTITGGPRNPANQNDARMIWKMRELGKLPSCAPITMKDMRDHWPNAYLIENNICMFKDDLIAMGLFSERVRLYGYIGQEFFARAEYLGIEYQFNHEAAVSHHGELEGENNFGRSKKERQIALADVLRRELMQPKHYEAQVLWAKSISDPNGLETSHPPFLVYALAKLPIRGLKKLFRSVVFLSGKRP